MFEFRTTLAGHSQLAGLCAESFKLSGREESIEAPTFKLTTRPGHRQAHYLVTLLSPTEGQSSQSLLVPYPSDLSISRSSNEIDNL